MYSNRNINSIKIAFALMAFVILNSFGFAQNKYKRTYPLKEIQFKHVASFATGNAVMFIDRDSLIENLINEVENSDYSSTSIGKIKQTVDTIYVLSQKSDITSISAIVSDPEIVGIVLSYYSKCILNKRANVLDKRTNEYVKKIIVKKSERAARSFSAYAWYYYFLPNDKKEFMHRVEKSGTGIKFL